MEVNLCVLPARLLGKTGSSAKHRSPNSACHVPSRCTTCCQFSVGRQETNNEKNVEERRGEGRTTEGERTELVLCRLSSSILQLPHGRYGRVWLVPALDRVLFFQRELKLATPISLVEVASRREASGMSARTAACGRDGYRNSAPMPLQAWWRFGPLKNGREAAASHGPFFASDQRTRASR